MAFLLPLGELVLEGMAMGASTNMGKEVYDTFAPKLKDASSDLLGKKIGGYAHDNPNGFVAQTLEKSYQYSKYPRPPSQHNHRHRRSGSRRTH
jgi:hypothetical protein